MVGLIDTTVGRLIFNSAVPQNLGYVDRSLRENTLTLEIEKVVDKNALNDIVARSFEVNGSTVTCNVLDEIKRLGFMYSTKGAVTISVGDLAVPKEKETLWPRPSSRFPSLRPTSAWAFCLRRSAAAR